ncbi:hypothetical protein OG21DRAFT_1416382 [Imleria badia]|nr:hypothetical protein OG21DRAFT_1416382 [Imleria badia]
MADCLAEDFEFRSVTTDPTEEQISAVQRVAEYTGRTLANSLGTNALEDIPMLLQIAFPACLASGLSHAVSSWAFEPGNNTFIYGIYQRLRSAEAQATSGRWRALARLYNAHSWSTQPASLVNAILTYISDILLAVGCTAPQSDILSKVTTKFGEKITSLVELAGRLGKMFDEVISSDFEVFIVRPGEKFDDKMMEDMDGDQAGIQEGPVLCTTHLGLIKRMPMGTSLWERGKKQKVTVLKAKVLLESSLNMEVAPF